MLVPSTWWSATENEQFAVTFALPRSTGLARYCIQAILQPISRVILPRESRTIVASRENCVKNENRMSSADRDACCRGEASHMARAYSQPAVISSFGSAQQFRFTQEQRLMFALNWI
jgi:hypothetical protein